MHEPERIGQRGLSLIELLFVLVIITILTAIAYPRLAVLAPIYRLEGSARSLALELQKVRGRAIAEGRCFQVTFNSTERTYQVRSKPGVSPCADSGFTTVETPPIAVNDSGSIGIESPFSPGSAPQSPVFDTRGRASTTSSIRLFNPHDGARAIFVQSSGRVYVQ